MVFRRDPTNNDGPPSGLLANLNLNTSTSTLPLPNPHFKSIFDITKNNR